MKNIKILFGLLFLIMLHSCDKECFSPPDPFRLVLLNSDGYSIITSSNEDNIKLFIADSNNNVEIPANVLQYYDVAQDVNTYYIESSDLAWKSIEGTKNYLLTIANDSISLGVDVFTKTVDKCTTHPYNIVSCDGQLVTEYNNNIGAFIAVK
ncbi:MAG TPA: hypothetical protein PKH93_05920 [Chitinophagales bacterium]|nr:hypothetical protein [Chitinophagales bacterium]